MPCPPSSQFDKYQKSTRNENASNFLCCQSPFVCSVHFAGFSPAFVPQSLSLSVDGFWHLRTSTVIDWHWLGLRWIIPRNAADRYHDSTATLANPYIDTWALSSSCPHCLQNTEGAKEEDTGNTGRGNTDHKGGKDEDTGNTEHRGGHIREPRWRWRFGSANCS